MPHKIGWRKAVKDFYDQIAKRRAGFYNRPNTLASKFQDKVLEKVSSVLSSERGSMLLDVGCGRGRYVSLLSSAGYTYVGVDISLGMLKIARHNDDPLHSNHFVQVTAEQIPFKDKTFDSVICIDLLHHLRSNGTREETIRELARVAKSDGQIVIEIKNKVNVIYWLLSKFNPSPVAETVSLREILLFLKTLGFSRIEMKGVGFPVPTLSPLVLIVCTKRRHVGFNENLHS